jgi:hypothetical protein
MLTDLSMPCSLSYRQFDEETTNKNQAAEVECPPSANGRDQQKLPQDKEGIAAAIGNHDKHVQCSGAGTAPTHSVRVAVKVT